MNEWGWFLFTPHMKVIYPLVKECPIKKLLAERVYSMYKNHMYPLFIYSLETLNEE